MKLLKREANVTVYRTKRKKIERMAEKMIKGFKMKLYPGMEAEYEKRHNQL